MVPFDLRKEIVVAFYKFGEKNGAIEHAGYAGKYLLMAGPADQEATDGVSSARCRSEVEAVESVSQALRGRPEGASSISVDLLQGVTWDLGLR